MAVRRLGSVAFVVAVVGVAVAQPVQATAGWLAQQGDAAAAASAVKADLRVDANRDGVVDLKGASDVAGKKTASAKAGALFLPNLDDDAKRCKMKDAKGKDIPRPALLACNDAQDEIINGNADAADLARVHAMPMPSLSDKATVTLRPVGKGAAFVRMFYVDGPQWKPLPKTGVLPARLAQKGLTLGLEGKVAATNKAVWDGTVSIGMTVKDGAATSSDSVMLRQAPILMSPHTQNATHVATTAFGNDGYEKRLKAAVASAAPKVPFTIIPSGVEPWAQDQFEPMVATMPQGKGMQSMTLNVIPGVERREMRAYFILRGPNVGFVQVGNPQRTFENKSVDYSGNIEVLPPHPGYPLGRVMLGDWTINPAKKTMVDPAMRAFFAAQELQGEPLSIDAGWLAVGHLDEFLTTVPAKNELGWKLLVGDVEAYQTILKDMKAKGMGKQKLSPNTTMYTLTVDEHLDATSLKHYALVKERVQNAVDIIKKATGITDADIVKVPATYVYNKEFDPNNGEWVKPDLPGGMYTMKTELPNPVNSLILGNKAVVAKQFGQPVDGKDPFEQAVTAAYTTAGLSPIYVDDVFAAHIAGGDIHCTTATAREAEKWWSKIN